MRQRLAKKFVAGRFMIVDRRGRKLLAYDEVSKKEAVIDMERATPYLDSRRNLYVRTDDPALKTFE